MFNRKKPEPHKKRSRDLSQFGLFDISDDFDPSKGIDNDEADSDLEAELAAITSVSGDQKPKPKSNEKKLIPPSDLDRMVAESLKDIGSDDESSVDDNDPDLLGELQNLTGENVLEEEKNSPVDATTASISENKNDDNDQIFLPTTTSNVVQILKNRIKMYELAESNAKKVGEQNRARRFNRGLKTLKDLLNQANSGKNINIDDIPPEVSTGKPIENTVNENAVDNIKEDNNPKSPEIPSKPAPEILTRSAPDIPTGPIPEIPTRPASAIPEPMPSQTTSIQQTSQNLTEKDSKLAVLNARKNEYKLAALEAKRAGNKESALQFVKIIKQFDVVIKAGENGEEIDLSDMPPPPNELADFLKQMQSQAQETNTTPQEPAASEPQPQPPEEKELVPDAPKTVLEGLQQRLEKYKSVEAAAKAEGNSSKVRRYGRIVKQYEDTIKLYKAGKTVQFDELPIPPGFGPLPTEGSSSSASNTPSVPVSAPTPLPKPSASTQEGNSSESDDQKPKKPLPSKKPLQKQESTVTRISGNQVATTLVEKQMEILLQRQNEFKVAAIEAKKAGEIEQAKEYLKIYKGFESLLNVASGGLPVDLSTLPIPPSQRSNLEDSFAFVSDSDCDPNNEISDISIRMEEQLAKQLMMCKNTRDHHKAMGDIAGMNRFENLALSVQKDLDLVRYSRRKNLPIPKFHYEQKSFNIVHCNTDLIDNEVEVKIVRGITYNVPNPKDVDTYVKLEFPYPQDYPFKARTQLVKNTDSPDYDQTYKIEIQRTNRQCQRTFKRHSAKFEVYSRGGFLRSDVLIGTVNVKLQPLETKCDIHDTFDLMDGRKVVGGKLEIKIRIRNPILTKQIEHVNEKWLIIDA